MAADVRGCVILDRGGEPLAASGEPEAWARAAGEVLDAAGAAGETPSQIHVATGDGEVHALREAGLALVAVTDRFTLASLILWDMRAILRDLASGGDGSRVGRRVESAR